MGGFLVSRFIGIDSEQRGADLRLQEANDRLAVAVQDRDAALASVIEHQAWTFLTDCDQATRLVADETPPSAAELLKESDEDLSAEV
jgi:hypothetical protein